MKAVVWPLCAWKEICSRTQSSAPGYLKETSLNSISPLMPAGSALGSSGSSMETSLSSTSPILFMETMALGRMMETMDSMRKDIMICMVYWMYAIISPTCMFPRSTWEEPTQTMRMLKAFMMSIIRGCMMPMSLDTKRLVFVRSLLATSNFFSSCLSVLKARMTMSPTRESLTTMFTLSTRVCSFLNLGRAVLNMMTTTVRMAMTPTAMTHAMDLLVFSALMMPPTPRIGAKNTILRSITENICTCWMSLVLLVMSDAVEDRKS